MLRLVAVGRGCVGERVATQAAPVSVAEQEAEATKRQETRGLRPNDKSGEHLHGARI